jgi:cytosine/adenosine deaminase-related metal-dependent hydrolase
VTAPVTGQERTEPIAVDTVVTGEWIIMLNADREIYRDGAIAVSGGVITEVGKRAAMLAKYRPATLIDEPGSIVIPGLINGHRHLLCCAKGAMPEGGQTLSARRRGHPGPDRSLDLDLGPGGPGRRRRAARLAADGRRCGPGPPGPGY